MSIAIQPNGRIVQLGYSFNENSIAELGIFRHLPDGRPDPSFGAHGSGGRLTRVHPGGSRPAAVALQPDGRILSLAERGSRQGKRVLLVRYDRDGTLDRSFGKEGRADTSPLDHSYHDYTSSLADVVVQPDGRILVGFSGFLGRNASANFMVARFLPDGSIDSSFGQNGMTSVDFDERRDTLADLAIDGRGGIVAAGTVLRLFPPPPASSEEWVRVSAMGVTRLRPDGSLDARFGRAGRSIVRFSPGLRVDDTGLHSLAVQSDGELVLAGGTTGREGSGPAFAVLRRNGDLNESFGRNGRVTPEMIPGLTFVGTISVDDADRIVGTAAPAGPPDEGGVMRMLPSGMLDSTFGAGGVAPLELSRDAGTQDIEVVDGRLVTGGGINGKYETWRQDFAVFAFQA